MPEYPDVTLYVEALGERVIGARLKRIDLFHPFLLRSVDPPPAELAGRRVESTRRIGKQIVVALEGALYVVIHLMIAGRLRWVASEGAGREAAAGNDSEGSEIVKANAREGSEPAADVVPGPAHGAVNQRVRPAPPAATAFPRKNILAAFVFDRGTLTFTEAGSKKRASLHLVRGDEGLAAFDRGGIELFESTPEEFRSALLRENHTLKRALTDPRLFSGIGNAYSDEILLRARLSPLKQTGQLSDEESGRLFDACRSVLREWTERLRLEAGGAFPEKVTAFHEEMAAHGKFGKPCPACGTAIQRIVYAENECNYCPTCQTEGRLLADRSLSRLLKGDWPRSLEELEELKRPRE